MALANKALGRDSTSFASYTQAALPAAVTLTDEEVEARSALVTTESIERSIDQFSDLTHEEMILDRDLYAILVQSISGKYRVTITRVQIPSFVQAWVLLLTELGATNIRRKTNLLGQLQQRQS